MLMGAVNAIFWRKYYENSLLLERRNDFLKSDRASLRISTTGDIKGRNDQGFILMYSRRFKGGKQKYRPALTLSDFSISG